MQQRLILALILTTFFSSITSTAKLPAKFRETFHKLQGVRIENPCDKPVRNIERLGENTLALESFICTEGNFEAFKRIVADFNQYSLWVLQNINEKLTGGSYFIKFLELESPAKKSVRLTYQVDIPLFKKLRAKTFELKSESLKGVFQLVGDGIEDPESLMAYTHAELTAFPAPGQPNEIWIHVVGKTQLKSSLLYQALPEKVLRSEAGDRIARVLENYKERETTIQPIAKSSPGPK